MLHPNEQNLLTLLSKRGLHTLEDMNHMRLVKTHTNEMWEIKE
jgi:hypothetical protein